MKIIAIGQGDELIVSMSREEWRLLADAQGLDTSWGKFEGDKRTGSVLDPKKILDTVRKVKHLDFLADSLEREGKALLELAACINTHKEKANG